MTKSKKIDVGAGKVLGLHVQIGAVPGRKIPDLRLVIGKSSNIRSGSVIYLGSRIGSHLETGHHAVIREENAIGDHFSLWTNSIVD